MSRSYVVGFGLAIALTAALFAFLKFTSHGKAIRATSQNQDVALACGIDTVQVRTLAFGIGAALAAAAGTIISMTGFIWGSSIWRGRSPSSCSGAWAASPAR